MIERIREATRAIAAGVGVVGLINIQFALLGDSLYVLEANPRASRTVPFVSKATATQLAKAASLIMMGTTIAQLREQGMLRQTQDGTAAWDGSPIAVKEAVMPFNRFRTPDGTWVDSLLGPEMKSTGEVMGLSTTFGIAFAKSQTASFGSLPTQGRVFVSVANRDKRHAIFPVKRLADLGFEIVATAGTASVLRRQGVPVIDVRKASQGLGKSGEPTSVSMIMDDQIDLIFNTPHGQSTGDANPRIDGYNIRAAAIMSDTPCITTVQGLSAAGQGIAAQRAHEVGAGTLQQWAEDVRSGLAGLES